MPDKEKQQQWDWILQNPHVQTRTGARSRVRRDRIKTETKANPSAHYQDANCSAATAPANQLLRGGVQQGLQATEEFGGILVPGWSTGALRHIGGKTQLHICLESASAEVSQPAEKTNTIMTMETSWDTNKKQDMSYSPHAGLHGLQSWEIICNSESWVLGWIPYTPQTTIR